EGSLTLPGKGRSTTGNFGLSFAFRDKSGKGPAEIRVIAGPYISLEFLGMTRKTLRLNLVDAPLAQLEAYGGLLYDPSLPAGPDGGRVRTIPDQGFPVYNLQIHRKI